MSIYAIDWHWFKGSGDGYHTIDVNIPPAQIAAQIWLHGTTGGGTQYAGIKHYRQRLSDGSDLPHDFGEWPSWPPVVFDFMSSITFAIAAGEDQVAWAMARMDYWAW
jgi:hypothetical protein